MMRPDKIMIVDDNTDNLVYLQKLLLENGYETFPANSGELALASIEQVQPDLFLLDIKMPGMDGFEVCKNIKETEIAVDVPVIFLSVADDIEAKLKGFRLGAVDYITKPFQKEELLARIKTHLSLFRYNRLFREQTAEKLIESEQQLKEGERLAHIGSWKMDIGSGKSVWSDEFFRICGYEPGAFEPTMEKGLEIIHPADREMASQKIQLAVESRTPYSFEKRIVRPDGTIRWVHTQGEVQTDTDGNPKFLGGSFLDVTDRRDIEEKLRISIREKELLLQEIHHRVKNNMQIISSLLNLQVNQTSNSTVKSVLSECRNRVYAMSMVHEVLYSSENMAEIDLTDYLSRVCRTVISSYSHKSDHVTFVIESETIDLPIKAACPLGLIVNELVSNAMKYAFPNESQGEIKVSVSKDNHRVTLTVADNGIGFPENQDWRNCPSLGLTLVRSFAENQLEGTMEMNPQNGTRFIITFDLMDKDDTGSADQPVGA